MVPANTANLKVCALKCCPLAWAPVDLAPLPKLLLSGQALSLGSLFESNAFQSDKSLHNHLILFSLGSLFERNEFQSDKSDTNPQKEVAPNSEGSGPGFRKTPCALRRLQAFLDVCFVAYFAVCFALLKGF